MSRRSAIALLLLLAASSGGCTLFTVHAQDGSDQMPLELRSSSDRGRPAAGLDAQRAATRPSEGVLTRIISVRNAVVDWFNLDEFKGAAFDLASPDARRRRVAIETVVTRAYGREEPYTRVYRTAAQFDPDGLVRATAVRAINRSRDGSAGSVLVAALSDGEPLVRLEAAKALANLPTPEAEAPLRALAQSADADVDARLAALDAMRHYKTLDTQRALVAQLGGDNFSLAWQARRSLFLQTSADYRYDESAWLTFLTTTSR